MNRYIYIYIYMYVCMYVCMYLCIFNTTKCIFSSVHVLTEKTLFICMFFNALKQVVTFFLIF